MYSGLLVMSDAKAVLWALVSLSSKAPVYFFALFVLFLFGHTNFTGVICLSVEGHARTQEAKSFIEGVEILAFCSCLQLALELT